MKIRQFATIALLVLSSFAANSVAPSKTELEAMYDKAFREFDANNYAEALKDLDAIDARQPDLAESQNLRGVIMMRQMDYAKAETALQKALAADPKFWNARFNLAEIPFLQKNWPEARKRFQDLLNSKASELQGEATQLIQYKIMLTYLLEGKENMVQSLVAKFELAPDSAAAHYASAATALNKKDENGAKDWLTKAEKKFSPQLNKLFAESLYEVGWLEKPAGQTRAALELNSAADRAAQTKAFADAKFDQAEQALAQRDLTAARKLVDEADAAEPNQARVTNLRGEILLEQKDFDGAEAEFRKVLKTDPKSRDAQYNLAQVPFKKKEYAKARDRFEALFAVTTGADKDQAAQLIKFKIFLTLLLEGKDARAQKMMEQFQFTGDTPALYYAQAALEFKGNNPQKANEWVTSARKIYSPALNGVFSESFYDVGWLQTPVAAASPGAMVAETEQPEAVSPPTIEPTAIPAITLAQHTPAKTDALTLAGQANAAVPGMEATTSSAAGSPAASSALAPNTAIPTAALSPSVETPVASTASPAAARPVVAMPSASEGSEANDTAVAVASTTPATVLAPAQVRAWSTPTLMETISEHLNDPKTLLIVGMLLAAILLIGWVVIAEFRRRMMRTSSSRGTSTANEEVFEEAESVAPLGQFVRPAQLAGGPPQVSLQLRASEPAIRKAAMPLGKSSRSPGHGNGHSNGAAASASAAAAPTDTFVQPEPVTAFAPAALFDEGVGEPVDTSAVASTTFAPTPAEPEMVSKWAPFEESVSEPMPAPVEAPAVADSYAAPFVPETPALEPVMPTAEWTPEPQPIESVTTPEPAAAFEAPVAAQEVPAIEEPIVATTEAPAFTAPEIMAEEIAPVVFQAAPEPEPMVEAVAAPVAAPEALVEAPQPEPVQSVAAEPTATQVEEQFDSAEPIGQGQPIPYQITEIVDQTSAGEPAAPAASMPVAEPAPPAPKRSWLAGLGALRHSVATPAPAPQNITPEPTAQQPTTPVTMAQPTPTTPAPVIRTAPPAQPTGAAPQPAAPMQAAQPQPAGGGMHTAVQLTFSFEIASLQLTPTFKMGALQLRPTSRIVTMRLAPSQNPQPAMNLQVTFEIATVQLNGNALGMVRLTPSQQQRPNIVSSPAFNIAGLQLVSGADAAPVQLTPSQQGQASVLVTGGFQIATVEFSPSFEIASIILNSTSRNVNVQLPGTGPSAVEGAPVFEIANVQLSGNGEIGMMQLNPPGAAQKRA